MNSLVKSTQAFRRIAKDAILQDLCPKGMGVSVKKRAFFARQIYAAAQIRGLRQNGGYYEGNCGIVMG